MKVFSDLEIFDRAGSLLGDTYILSVAEGSGRQGCCAVTTRIESDGSTRRFWRVASRGARFIVAAPAGVGEAELAESRAAWHIGNHLGKKGVPVPKLYGWDAESGLLIYEDLGDIRLHDLLVRSDAAVPRPGAEYYHETLANLAVMQVRGAEGFDTAWCWDSPSYDIALMRERESGYFLRAFWQGILGEEVPPGVEDEFHEIALRASRAPSCFFLHRDFQSRNIMVKDDRVRFIDFQGGRLGPLGYDVASLLIDPYAALPLAEQEELLAIYLPALAAERPGAEEDFLQSYRLLALQRNLQIVGAFAFLSRVRGKVFFAGFLEPSLLALRDRLAESHFAEFPLVRRLVERGLAGLKGS